MIESLKNGIIKLLEIDQDKIKEKVKEIEQSDANAVIMRHQKSEKCIIVDKRFQKRLELDEFGSWKKVNYDSKI